MTNDHDRTGTVRDLIAHWRFIAEGRRITAADTTLKPDVRARCDGYANALSAAAAELQERLDDQPSDDATVLLTELRAAMRRLTGDIADAMQEADTVLRRLGDRG